MLISRNEDDDHIATEAVIQETVVAEATRRRSSVGSPAPQDRTPFS